MTVDPRAPITDGPADVEDLPEASFQALYGRVQPTTPAMLPEVLADAPFRWWLVGGWALEVATREAREHIDLDIGVLLDELPTVRRWALARGLDVWMPHPAGLMPLLPGAAVPEDREQLWLRRSWDQPWLLDVLLTPSDGEDWIFKRDPRVRRPLRDVIRSGANDVPYLAPEVVLLHKAHAAREKDEIDFGATVPLLDPPARAWLRDALATVHPGHDWIAQL